MMTMDATLLKNAMLGTDKVHRMEDVTDGRIDVLESLTENLATDSPSWRLLLKAGCYAVAHRAGYLPETVADDLPDVSADETRPAMPRPLAEVMQTIMKEYANEPFIGLYFLKRLAESGLRFPFEMLPTFLELTTQRKLFKEQAKVLQSLFGNRGRWLARQNENWQWLLDVADADSQSIDQCETIWLEGTFAQRESALRQIRQLDPARSRELLAETWKNEKPEHREKFLQVFEHGLCGEDIPFLNEAAKDRSKSVKQSAMLFLGHLPDSDYAKNALARVEPMIVASKSKWVGKKHLEIVPPEAFTKDMKAEGFDEKPPKGIGQRACWLSQSLACVPVVHWETHFEMQPAELLKALCKDDFFLPLLHGLTVAALRFDCDHWLEPLWENWSAIKQEKDIMPFDIRELLLAQLLRKMPREIWKRIKADKDRNPTLRTRLDSALQTLVQESPEDSHVLLTEILPDYIATFDAVLIHWVNYMPIFPENVLPAFQKYLETEEKKNSSYRNYLEKNIRLGLELRGEFDRLLSCHQKSEPGELSTG